MICSTNFVITEFMKLLLPFLLLLTFFPILDIYAQYNDFSIIVSSEDTSCSALCNGTITVDILSGTPIYPCTIKCFYPKDIDKETEVFTNVSFPFVFNNMCESTKKYKIVVEDSGNNIDFDRTILFGSNDIDIIGSSVSNTSNYHDCDGSINIFEVTGGTPGYTYLWDNGSRNSSIKRLCPGYYKVKITDKTGCYSFFKFDVSGQPQQRPNRNFKKSPYDV